MVTLNTLETSWGQKNFKNSKKFQIFGKILKIQKNFKFLEKFQKLTICGENIKKKLFLHKIFTFFCYICQFQILQIIFKKNFDSDHFEFFCYISLIRRSRACRFFSKIRRSRVFRAISIMFFRCVPQAQTIKQTPTF